VPKDRRDFAIHLSPGGCRALQHFERGLRLHQRALLACLSDDKRDALSAMLLRVIKAGNRLNEDAEAPARPPARRGCPHKPVVLACRGQSVLRDLIVK